MENNNAVLSIGNGTPFHKKSILEIIALPIN